MCGRHMGYGLRRLGLSHDFGVPERWSFMPHLHSVSASAGVVIVDPGQSKCVRQVQSRALRFTLAVVQLDCPLPSAEVDQLRVHSRAVDEANHQAGHGSVSPVALSP